MYKSAINKLVSLRKMVKTSIRKATKRSDYERWGTDNNLSASWDSRTEQIAKLIGPGTSVIEFGAGRLVLRSFLPQSCTYVPSDLVDRGEGTILCDLNSDPLPEFQSYDLAVFSGVLEYVNDVPRLILHLSNYVNAIIGSYAVTDLNKRNRRAQGWVNDFSSEQIIGLFEDAGFKRDHTEKWKSQIIYRFRKSI